MSVCDCIEKLNLTDGVTATEIDKHPCLKNTKDLPDSVYKNPLEIIDKGLILPQLVPVTKSVAILYKAIQEMKAEIDALKVAIDTIKTTNNLN
jgi:hypothetical protein